MYIYIIYIIYIYIFRPFEEPLPLKLTYTFNDLTNLCRGNLQIIEIVSDISHGRSG